MLEQMRKSSQSLLIYVLFGIVIAVFIINFGPQSRSGGHGCDGAMGGDDSAAEVAGETISAQAFRSAFMLLGGASQPPQMLKLRHFKEAVMDRLIERELLAQEASRLGYVVGEEDVHKMLLDGRIIGLGEPHTIPRIQKDGVFNYEQFKTFTQFELGLTPDRFVEQQQREMLAAEVRDLMRATIRVSPEEIKTAFDVKNRQINLEYVRFPSRKYEAEVEPTAEEIAAHVKTNEAKLKDVYNQRKHMYTDMPQEIRVREIVIKGKGGGDGKPEGAPDDDDGASEKRAAAVALRITKGEAFAKVARETSDDEQSRAAGGDLGWRRKGSLGLSDADEGKVFAAKPGDLVGPVKGAQGQGWMLLTPLDSRKGTMTFDQVKNELAEEQIKQAKAVDLAKHRAEAALAMGKAAPDRAFKDIFPGPSTDKPDPKAATAAKVGKPGAAPTLVDVRAEETGLFARRGTVIEQIGDSPALAKAAWDLTPASPLAGPFEVAGSYVVVRLKERKDPDPGELEKRKADLQRDAELAKWNDVFTGWVKHRCLEAKNAGKITVNKTVLKYDDGQDAPAYEPCGSDTARRPSS